MFWVTLLLLSLATIIIPCLFAGEGADWEKIGEGLAKFIFNFGLVFVILRYSVFRSAYKRIKNGELKEKPFIIGMVVIWVVSTIAIFGYVTYTQKNSNLAHLNKINEYADKANSYVFNAKNDQEVKESLDQYTQYMKKALSEAKQIDVDELDEQKEGWSYHFKNEFLPALEQLSTDGINDEEYARAQKLIFQYGEWAKKSFGLTDKDFIKNIHSMTPKQLAVILGEAICSKKATCKSLHKSNCAENQQVAIERQMGRFDGKLDTGVAYNCMRDISLAECDSIKMNKWPQSCDYLQLESK